MKIAIALVLAAQALLGEAAAQQPAQAALPNTCTTAPYRAFDFWIGAWDVFDRATNQPVGRSLISSHEEGCVIEEEWTGFDAHDTGRSLNMYDITTGKWLQFWMNTIGDVSRFEGGPTSEGGMHMVALNEMRPGGTHVVTLGIDWTPLADGSVRQHGTISRDGGRTWQDRYDYIYRRHTA